MLLVHEHKTETSWINTRTTCVAILSLSFMIYVSHHVDKCYWMIDLASHKSVPLGVFPCFLKVDWVDRLCLFRSSHILIRFVSILRRLVSYPHLSPSIPYSPQAEELVDHAEMIDGFGHLWWMRDRSDTRKWHEVTGVRQLMATESMGNQIKDRGGRLESSPHGPGCNTWS